MHPGLKCLFPVLFLSACTQPLSTADQKPDEASMTQDVIDLSPTGWVGKSLPDLVAALEAGEISSEALVKDYLARIAMVDVNGPGLQSVLAINPDILAAARAMDERRAAGETLGVLQGAPILIKDNIDTMDAMPTTAGALALKENFAPEDAPLVAAIRANDGLVLGKTNLSQWANFRSNNSVSGWSALGGQVRNPHVLDRSPCGSSSGSGAATAASLSAASVGTETNGSIICPSNANGIVGFKPTVGLVSQAGIIPISSTQDTAGPMTRTVAGAALLLGAMTKTETPTAYLDGLSADALRGKRVGVLRFTLNGHDGLTGRFDSALSTMTSAGAELVEITGFDEPSETASQSEWIVLTREFKTLLNAYLANTPEAVPVKSLADLIAFNEAHADVELAVFGQDILIESEESLGIDDPDYAAAVVDVTKSGGVNGIDALLAQYDVDVLVAPSGPVAALIDPVKGDVWGSWAGFGDAAAVSGYPHLTVPMGDVRGVPVGVSFIGTKGADASVLAYGYAYEQVSQARIEPQYLPTAEAHISLTEAMARKSDLDLPTP